MSRSLAAAVKSSPAARLSEYGAALARADELAREHRRDIQVASVGLAPLPQAACWRTRWGRL